MTKFLYDGDTVFMRSDMSVDMRDELEAGTYSIGRTDQGEYFLKRRSDMDIPEKIYGSPHKQAERIIRTSLDRSGSTGVLLAGEKGSGKTLLGKILTKTAREDHDIPTIVVNSPHCGEGFNRFIEQIEQPCIVFFDEFEKVYEHNELQEQLLTLFDGTYTSQKVFVITTNDRWRINSHMQNRPGRLFYLLEYEGLEEAFVREYCEDNLENKDHIETIVKLTFLFEHFNFDMLQALVQEMNRYKETVNESLQWINIQLADVKEKRFHVEVTQNGNPITLHSLGNVTKFSVLRGVEMSYLDNNETQKLIASNNDDAVTGAIQRLSNYVTEAQHSSRYIEHAFSDFLHTDDDWDKFYPDESKLHKVRMNISNLVTCDTDGLLLADPANDINIRLKPVIENSRNGIPADYLM